MSVTKNKNASGPNVPDAENIVKNQGLEIVMLTS